MPATATYSEVELVSLLQRQEESAFTYLYEHYSGALYGVILQVITDETLAQDILQEVFVKIYRNVGQFDALRGRLYTWMLNIARNAAIDAFRSKGFKQQKQNRDLEQIVDNTSYSLSTQVYVDHIGLEKVLNTLRLDYRQVIDLAYFKGYTQEEIAEELGIPLGTVKTRIRSALIQLRTILKEI